MANARFHGWGKRARSRRSALLLSIPLVCVLLLGTIVTYHLLPSGNSSRASNGTVQILGHVPGLVKTSTLLGQADAAKQIQLLVGFKPRDAQALKNYVDSMSLPQSANAHRYLTPAQVATAFAPAQSVQDALIAYMQQQGFSVASTYKQHLMIGFKGTIGDAEQAFSIQINNYRAPDGRVFYAPGSDPSVPDSFGPSVQSIIGLDDAQVYSHPPIPSKNANNSTTAQPRSGGCLPAQTSNYTYYIPNQIATAYNLTGLYNAGFQGQGQSVALFELDDFSASDIKAYTSCYGGASVPITRILVNGGTGAQPGSGAIEVELDMELVLSAAPKLAGLKVYEAANTAAGYIANWTAIVNDAVPVVSTSWGSCESSSFAQAVFNQENTLFQVAVLQGQSIFAASGDTGTNDCRNNPATTQGVDDPAAQPYVTGVGGTMLKLGPGSSYGSEMVWKDQYGAGGGGISSLWKMPSYQSNDPNTSINNSSGTPCGATSPNLCREVPDVSLNADPATSYPVYCTVVAAGCSSSNTWVFLGGTSAAAPMWAALAALANQKALHDGYFNIGFLNAYLYSIDQNQHGTTYANDFHDVTNGNNDTIDASGIFPATTNYDMASGLGSYNALSLANDIELIMKANGTQRTNTANTTWYFAEGSVGGSFSEYMTLLNPDPTNTATVNLTYLFQNKPAVIKQHLVPPSSRYTVNVNNDLGISNTAAQQAISTIVQSVAGASTPAVPIVAERPMYFNYRGVKSGTDVLGATNATNTTFYFAEGDNRQHSGNANYSTFITVLNPSNIQTATVTATFYTGSCGVSNQPACLTSMISVPPLYRGTILPPVHSQFSTKVTSNIGVVVERPMYFSDTIATAGGALTGSASAVGATTLGPNSGSDWLFAEGYTGPNFQEYLVLSNFTTANTQADVKLEYTNGTTQTVPVTVPALGQLYFDVNNANNNPIAGCSCTPTTSLSAEVFAGTQSIVAERLMYFKYGAQHLSGATDVVGQAGPASSTSFAFAEGYTGTNFYEYLTLQNPGNAPTVAYITLFADSTIVEKALQLQPHSRSTVYINDLIAPMAAAYPTNPIYLGYNVSMDIESISPIVAERPEYFNYNGDTGGTDVIGYTGG